MEHELVFESLTCSGIFCLPKINGYFLLPPKAVRNNPTFDKTKLF